MVVTLANQIVPSIFTILSIFNALALPASASAYHHHFAQTTWSSQNLTNTSSRMTPSGALPLLPLRHHQSQTSQPCVSLRPSGSTSDASTREPESFLPIGTHVPTTLTSSQTPTNGTCTTRKSTAWKRKESKPPKTCIRPSIETMSWPKQAKITEQKKNASDGKTFHSNPGWCHRLESILSENATKKTPQELSDAPKWHLLVRTHHHSRHLQFSQWVWCFN